MSMRTYGVNEYGLYVSAEALEDYAEKHELDVYEVAEEAGLVYFSDADGEGVSLFNDNEFSVDEYFYIGCLNKYPSLFEQAYKDKEEVLEEVKEKFQKYLPVDYDFESNVIHYMGTIFA